MKADAGPRPRRSRRSRRGPGSSSSALPAFLHLAQLGTHAFHHDESIHAYASVRLLKEGAYKYDPVYHGPVQYFAVTAVFAASSVIGKAVGVVTGYAALKTWDGTSDFTARLAPALAGVALTAMAFLLRRRFGARAAFAAGALCALSPNFLYYTRFCRDDAWSLLGTAGLFLWLDEYFAARRVKDLAIAALWAAVAFASKENFYVLLALMVPSVAAAWMEPGRGLDVWNRLRRLIDWLEENATAVVGALLLFFVTSEVLYTVFLVHPESGNPAFDAISYWWGQHKMERVGGPKTFYLPRLLQYEFAILLPALLYVFFRWRTLSFAERFVAGWAVSSVAMYAYLGEKAGWLIVHQVLPFLPLAGAAWALLPEKGPRLARRRRRDRVRVRRDGPDPLLRVPDPDAELAQGRIHHPGPDLPRDPRESSTRSCGRDAKARCRPRSCPAKPAGR